MELPKFVIADNTDFPDDIFIIHLDYPRFIINLKDDEIGYQKIISLKMGMPCVYKQVVATTPFMTITLIATLLMLQPMAHWF